MNAKLSTSKATRFCASLRLAACLVALGSSEAWADDALIVKAMTFNIRCNVAKDGPNQWTKRTDIVTDVIRRFDGDFIGIQEALPDQVADLHRLLPAYHSIGRSREASENRGEAMLILYRKDRWRVDPKKQGVFWLSDTPEKPGSNTWKSACTRCMAWGRFIELKTGRSVYVYDTHFDHRSETARRKSAVLIAERVAHRKLPEPAIVMGDLNTDESSVSLTYLTGQKPDAPIALVDTFRAIHPEAKQVGTFHGFSGLAGGGKIDFILATSGVKVLAAEIVRKQYDGRYPSDHFPVTAEIEFPELVVPPKKLIRGEVGSNVGR